MVEPIVNGQRQKIKQEFANAFGNKCCICKKQYPLVCYDFHHIEPDDKKISISQAWQYPELLLEEIQKCVMVCSNCHREIHFGLKDVPKNAIRFKDKNTCHCKKLLL